MTKMEYVQPFYADQHLTRDSKSTLCGLDREDVRADIPFRYHFEGFRLGITACKPCADEADRLHGLRR